MKILFLMILCFSGCGWIEQAERNEEALERCRHYLNVCGNRDTTCQCEIRCPECEVCPTIQERDHYRDCARRAREYGLAVHECGTDEERFGTEREHVCTNVDRLEARCPIFRGGT